MSAAVANSRARCSRWASSASEKDSPRPERISISDAISSPAAAFLEAVLELEALRVDDRELLLDADREVGGLVEDRANALEVECLVHGVVSLGSGLRGAGGHVR